MTHARATLVRLAALALGLVAYALLVVPAMTEPRDANIGAGLIAFAAVSIVSLVWSFVDGLRHGGRTALARWMAVAGVLAVGWWVTLAAIERDASTSFVELLVADTPIVPFLFLLVAAPCALGALVGQAVRRR